MLDELGHQVDAGCVNVKQAQMFGEVPRPAANIEHCAPPDQQMSGDEVKVVVVSLRGRTEQFYVTRRLDDIGISNLFHRRAPYGELLAPDLVPPARRISTTDSDDPGRERERIYGGLRMKVACIVFAYIVGAFFVVRAVVEVVTVDYAHAASYEKDWGGPSLLGVLTVHCLPGAIALALMVWGALRLRRKTVD